MSGQENNTPENSFDIFQLEEYKNISNAHFETNKQIGTFFRYFLLIASAPTLIFVWFGKNDGFLNDLLNGIDTHRNIFIGFFLLVVSFIGLMSCFYLISLRLDSILYARAVNGIRGFFYRKKIDFEEHYRTLPKQTNQPKYRDSHTFGILVYSIALIDAIYFATGTIIIASVGDDFFNNYLHVEPIIKNYNIWWSFGSFAVFFISHIFYYGFISKYRRNMYLKSSIIGIDIDGVLNKHRETFCQKHLENMITTYGEDPIPSEMTLNPDEIIRIPVNLIDNKNISVDNEFDVFNHPSYWSEQIVIKEDIGKVIKELKNSFGYKINIHSYRPWPQYEYGNNLNETKINELWGIKTIDLWNNKKIRFGKKSKLKRLTKKWLKNAKIPFNNLFIEKSSIDYSSRSLSFFGIIYNISNGQFKNRFYYTNKKPYRYFIEDTPENAIKLASTCEYVFLIEQPYNSEANFQESLPINVIRVKNWSEIKNIIKKLG